MKGDPMQETELLWERLGRLPDSELPGELSQYISERIGLLSWVQDVQRLSRLRREAAFVYETLRHRKLGSLKLDLQELCRRAEYRLVQGIRDGQANGTVLPADYKVMPRDARPDIPSAWVLLKAGGSGGGTSQIQAMADGVPAEVFEAALAEGRRDSNLSRPHVSGILKRMLPGGPEHHAVPRIRELANRGFTSAQIAPELRLTEPTVRRLCREHNISLPADTAFKGGRGSKINHTKMVRETVSTVDAAANGLKFINVAEADLADAAEWVEQLSESIRDLTRFRNQIREMITDGQ